MATLPNPNPIPNQGFLEYSYTVDPSLPDINAGILSNTVFSQVNVAELQITKASNLNYVKSGDTVTYTIVLKNTGNISADNVSFLDTVPSGFSFNQGSVTVNGVANLGNPTLGFTIPSIAANTSTTIIFTVKVNTIPTTNPLNNTAATTYDFIYDPSTPKSQVDGKISNIVPVTVMEASINTITGGLVKSADKTYVTKNEVVTYTIGVKNTGNTTANNVVLKDTIPAATSFVSNSLKIDGVTQLGMDITNPLGISLGNIPSGGVKTVEFKVVVNTVPNPNVLTNDAFVNFTYTMDPSLPNGNTGGGISNLVNVNVNYASFNAAEGGFTKTPNVTESTVGDEITYTIVLKNLGNTNSNNVTFKDTIPNGTTFVQNSVYVDGTNMLSANPSGGINVGTIAPNQVKTITFKVLVVSIPTPNPIQNQGKVDYTYTVNPSIPNGTSVTNLSSIATTQINYAKINNSDGGFVKSADVQKVDLGNQITYTIVMKNTGNVNATNVVLYDTIPSEATFVSGSTKVDGVSSADNPQTGVNIGTITPGQVVTVNFAFIIATLPLSGVTSNTADVKYSYLVDGVDRTDRTVTNTVVTGVVSGSLAVNKISNKGFADIGEEITYTITVENTGNVKVESAIVKDTIPEGTSYVAGSLTVNGTPAPSANPITGYNIGSLLVGEIKVVQFKVLIVSIPSVNPIVNIADVDFTYIVQPSDPLATGKSSGTSGGTEIKNANFNKENGGFTKTSSSQFVKTGEEITYTIVAKNLGNVAANNVIVTDSISSNTQFVPGSTTINGIPSVASPITGINLGTVGANEAKTITFKVLVVSTVPSTITNVADIMYEYKVDPNDPAVGKNEKSTVVTEKINEAIISGSNGDIVKNSNLMYATKGDIVTYSISVKNSGNVNATNVVLHDTLPSQVSFVKDSVTINTVAAPGVDMNDPLGVGLGTIAPGQTVVVAFKVLVNEVPNPNNIRNDAFVTFNFTKDPSIPNGEVSGGISNPKDVFINYAGFNKSNGNFAKTSDKNEATIGDEITYTIKLKNEGNTDANNVILTDTMPEGTTFVLASVRINNISSPLSNPVTGINIGTIMANETVTVSFKVLVVSVPTSNPIKNEAILKYSYTVNPTMPNGKNVVETSSIAENTINYAAINNNTGGFTKTANKQNVDLGTNIRYTLMLKNTGNVDAKNVILYDTIPEGASFVNNSLTINGVQNSGNPQLGVPIGTISPGSSVEVAFTVFVESIPSGDILKNSADVSYGYSVNGVDTIVRNTSNLVQTPVINADLDVTKVSNKTFADIGENINYTIIVKNTGNVVSMNTIVTDLLPNGTVFVANSLKVDGGIVPGVNPENGVNVGSIDKGKTKTVEFTVLVTSIPNSNPIVNAADIKFSYIIDPSLPLGSKTETGISGGTTIKNANFSKENGGFYKAASEAFVTIGDEVTFTLILKNLGNAEAQGVIVKDKLQENLQFVTGSVIVNGVSNSGNISTGINIGTVSPSSVATVTFKAIVTSTVPSLEIANKGTVEYAYVVDPDKTSVKKEEESTQVNMQIKIADIELNKASDETLVYLNNIVEYTINVINHGNVDAENVLVIDTLVDGVQFIENSVEINGVQQIGKSIITGVVIPVVKPKENKVLTFKVRATDVPRGGIFTNVAKASYQYTVNPNDPPTSRETTSNESLLIITLFIDPDKEVEPTDICKNNNNMKNVIPLNASDSRRNLNSSCGRCYPLKYSVEGICTPEEKACMGVDIREYKMWKQTSIGSNLDLEVEKINEIESITAKIVFVRDERVKTPISNCGNIEGETLSGYKNIVESMLIFKLRVITCDGEIVTREFKQLFSTFVVINSEYLNLELEPRACIEDITIDSLCNGIISITSTVLIYLMPESEGSCGENCGESCIDEINSISNSNLCKNISEFLDDKTCLWKEFDVFRNFNIEKTDIGDIVSVKADVNILNHKIILTPIAMNENMEGHQIFGKKILVNMIVNIKVNYISTKVRGAIRRANFNVPVGKYIAISNDDSCSAKYNLSACIEDVFVCRLEEERCNKLPSQYVFTNTTLIIKAIPCEVVTCKWQ